MGWDVNNNIQAVAQLEAGKGYFVVLNSACDITETEDINISIDSYIPISVIQGKTGKTNFTLRNLGNRHVDPITIAVSDFMNTKGDLLDSSDITLPTTNTQIRIAENEIIEMEYDIPTAQEAGVYTGFVTITYAGKSLVQEVSVTIIPINEQVSINYEPISSLQGIDLPVNVSVTNNGNVDLINIQADMTNMYNEADSDSMLVGITAPPFNLNVGETENVSL